MYKKRHVQERLKLLAKNFKVVLVVGPRQIGKTTLLQNMFPGTPFVSFELADLVEKAQRDPKVFLETYPSPTIFDEVQYAPNLLGRIKAVVDTRPEKGQYFLTGSQNLSMLKGVAESMAGRVGILDLTAMSLHEQYETFSFVDGEERPENWLARYIANPSWRDLAFSFDGVLGDRGVTQALWRGGVPDVTVIDERLVTDYFDSYLRTYIDRDVRISDSVSSLANFSFFIRLVGALSGHEINFTQLGREIGIERRTAQLWLQQLQRGYLWHNVPSYTRNAVNKVVKRGKGYLFDTGLAAYLQRIDSPQGVASHPNFGALFETYCFNMIRQLMGSMNGKPGIYYWRTTRQTEVDFILEMNGKLYPIEVKLKSRPNGYDARGIQAFQRAYPNESQLGLILHAGTDCYRAADTVLCLPYNALMR